MSSKKVRKSVKCQRVYIGLKTLAVTNLYKNTRVYINNGAFKTRLALAKKESSSEKHYEEIISQVINSNIRSQILKYFNA